MNPSNELILKVRRFLQSYVPCIFVQLRIHTEHSSVVSSCRPGSKKKFMPVSVTQRIGRKIQEQDTDGDTGDCSHSNSSVVVVVAYTALV